MLSRTLLHFFLVLITGKLLHVDIDRRNEERKENKIKVEKLEELNQRTEDFLTNVSHELRTPINAVTGITTVMLNNEMDNKKREDLLARKKIIQESGATLTVSIHLNSFPQDVSVYGAQVFYPRSSGGQTEVQKGEHSSRDFAESVQKSLETNIDDGREREAMTKNDILIFENTEARIILVECGFLSNPKECSLLQTPEYQRQLSQAVWEGINEILCLKKPKEIQVIDSANRDG